MCNSGFGRDVCDRHLGHKWLCEFGELLETGKRSSRVMHLKHMIWFVVVDKDNSCRRPFKKKMERNWEQCSKVSSMFLRMVSFCCLLMTIIVMFFMVD